MGQYYGQREARGLEPCKNSKEGPLIRRGCSGIYSIDPILRELGPREKIGRLKSYEAIQSLFKADKMIGLSKRSLQATWKQYECIAHLWAAFILVSDFANEETMIKFLTISEVFRKWGEQYTPPQSDVEFLELSHYVDHA